MLLSLPDSLHSSDDVRNTYFASHIPFMWNDTDHGTDMTVIICSLYFYYPINIYLPTVALTVIM